MGAPAGADLKAKLAQCRGGLDRRDGGRRSGGCRGSGRRRFRCRPSCGRPAAGGRQARRRSAPGEGPRRRELRPLRRRRCLDIRFPAERSRAPKVMTPDHDEHQRAGSADASVAPAEAELDEARVVMGRSVQMEWDSSRGASMGARSKYYSWLHLPGASRRAAPRLGNAGSGQEGARTHGERPSGLRNPVPSNVAFGQLRASPI